ADLDRAPARARAPRLRRPSDRWAAPAQLRGRGTGRGRGDRTVEGAGRGGLMRATVIVPTHDHGALIEHAVASATRQTERDIEILIVGDGVPKESVPAIERIVASDPRIRFLDLPKGPGHGFRHRDDAIREAAADNILYLCDDDIWFPEHVA